MEKQKIKKYVSFSLKFIVTAIFFILIFDKVDFNSTFQILKATDSFFFMIALLVVIIEVLVANIRWCLVLKQLNLNISFIKALRYLWIGVFFNQALPSSIGGDAVRVYYLCKKELYSFGQATLGVLLDRITGLLGLVLLVVFTMPLIFDSVIGLSTKWTILIVIISALLAISLTLIIDLMPNNLLRWKLINGLTRFSSKGRGVLFSFNGILSIIISIIIHLSFVYAAWLLAQALSIDISLTEMLLIVPITNLLIALPISIAGWGVREGLFIAGLGYLNVSADSALALSILYGLLMLVVSIPGLIDWLIRKPKN